MISATYFCLHLSSFGQIDDYAKTKPISASPFKNWPKWLIMQMQNIFLLHLAVLDSTCHMFPLAAVPVQHPHSTRRKYDHAQPELSKLFLIIITSSLFSICIWPGGNTIMQSLNYQISFWAACIIKIIQYMHRWDHYSAWTSKCAATKIIQILHYREYSENHHWHSIVCAKTILCSQRWSLILMLLSLQIHSIAVSQFKNRITQQSPNN